MKVRFREHQFWCFLSERNLTARGRGFGMEDVWWKEAYHLHPQLTLIWIFLSLSLWRLMRLQHTYFPQGDLRNCVCLSSLLRWGDTWAAFQKLSETDSGFKQLALLCISFFLSVVKRFSWGLYCKSEEMQNMIFDRRMIVGLSGLCTFNK